MHKLIRYYSQNRMKVWIIILAIIFLLAIIQVLNNIAKEENQNRNEKETADNVVSYRNESKSIITGGSVAEVYQEGFGETINQFFTYCIKHQPEKAYELLAPDTKKILYPTQAQFEDLYYKEKFEGNKEFSFQSWSRTRKTYVYQVKIFEDMLASGKKSNEYMEDYVTIVPVEDSYKLNINSYVGRKTINKKGNNDKITVDVAYSDQYMDYEIYTFRIKNNTEEEILLDTREKTDTIYLINENDNKLESFLYEVTQEDLILKPQEAKTIQIKFNNAYRSDRKIKSVNFADITNYNEIYTLKVDL